MAWIYRFSGHLKGFTWEPLFIHTLVVVNYLSKESIPVGDRTASPPVTGRPALYPEPLPSMSLLDLFILNHLSWCKVTKTNQLLDQVTVKGLGENTNIHPT